MPTDRAVFLNRLLVLYSLDPHEVVAAGGHLTSQIAREMCNDPARFLMRCDDATADALWRAIEARHAPKAKPAGPAP